MLSWLKIFIMVFVATILFILLGMTKFGVIFNAVVFSILLLIVLVVLKYSLKYKVD